MALVIPYVLGRFGSRRGMLLVSGMLGVLLLPMTIPVWWVAGFGHMAAMAMSPIRYAVYTIYLLDRTPTEQQPFVSGFQELVLGAAFATTALIGGYMIAWNGYTFYYLTSIGAVFIGVALLWFYLYGPLPLFRPPAGPSRKRT